MPIYSRFQSSPSIPYPQLSGVSRSFPLTSKQPFQLFILSSSYSSASTSIFTFLFLIYSFLWQSLFCLFYRFYPPACPLFPFYCLFFRLLPPHLFHRVLLSLVSFLFYIFHFHLPRLPSFSCFLAYSSKASSPLSFSFLSSYNYTFPFSFFIAPFLLPRTFPHSALSLLCILFLFPLLLPSHSFPSSSFFSSHPPVRPLFLSSCSLPLSPLMASPMTPLSCPLSLLISERPTWSGTEVSPCQRPLS